MVCVIISPFQGSDISVRYLLSKLVKEPNDTITLKSWIVACHDEGVKKYFLFNVWEFFFLSSRKLLVNRDHWLPGTFLWSPTNQRRVLMSFCFSARMIDLQISKHPWSDWYPYRYRNRIRRGWSNLNFNEIRRCGQQNICLSGKASKTRR